MYEQAIHEDEGHLRDPHLGGINADQAFMITVFYDPKYETVK